MALAKTITLILGTAGGKTAGASSSTTLTDCTTIDTTDCIGLAIDVSANCHVSATAGYRVKLYGSYNDSSFNTNPFWQFDVAYTAATRSVTADVPHGAKYIKAQVTNLDTGQSLIGIYVRSIEQTA